MLLPFELHLWLCLPNLQLTFFLDLKWFDNQPERTLLLLLCLFVIKRNYLLDLKHPRVFALDEVSLGQLCNLTLVIVLAKGMQRALKFVCSHVSNLKLLDSDVLEIVSNVLEELGGLGL